MQPSPITAKDYGKKNEGKFYKLTRSIFEYLSGISLGMSFQWPRNFYDLERFLNELAETHPSNRFISSALGRSVREGESTSENLEKIWSLSEKDLLRLYYEGLLRKTGGNVNLASDLAKENKSTLRSRLKKLGIRYGKTETKTEK